MLLIPNANSTDNSALTVLDNEECMLSQWQHCFVEVWHKLIITSSFETETNAGGITLLDVIVWKVFTCCTVCSTATAVWMYSPVCACSVSIIRQLYRSEGIEIIVCFLFQSARSSVKCESIHCCLGYIFLLVFSASINNAEGSDLRGSPHWYESTVGTQCENEWTNVKKKDIWDQLNWKLSYKLYRPRIGGELGHERLIWTTQSVTALIMRLT